MQTHDITGLVQLLGGVYRLHVSGNHCIVRTIGIIRIYVHAEALRDTRYVTAYVSESMDTEFLAFQLRAACAVIEVTHGIDHEPQSQLCHGIAVLSGGVHRYNLVLRSGLQVDIVITRTGTDYNLQLFRCVQHRRIHHIRTDDQCIRVSHSIQQLLFVGIFLQERQFVSCALYHFANTVHGHLRKGFFCCY